MNHAHQAIMIVQATLLMHFLPNREMKKQKSNSERAAEDQKLTKEFRDRIAVLVIAYHNLGVEQEFMKMYHEAVQSYYMAKTFAEKYLTPEDDITVNLTQIYERAKKEIDIQINKVNEKDARIDLQRKK